METYFSGLDTILVFKFFHMKVGIIGSGAVGQTLGNAFLQEGHEVMLGTRNVGKGKTGARSESR